MTETNQQGDSFGGLMEHLVELRTRLIRMAISIAVASLICYGYSEIIFNFLREPIAPYLPTGGLVFTAPMDKFMAHVKISIVSGTILSCPFWLYQIWKFIAPALYDKEKKYAVTFISVGTVLFLIGISFAYYLALPAAFEFLMGFGGDIDKPMITITDYVSFFVLTLLMFGLSFELPLIIVILGLLGVVSQKFLREKRRILIVGLAVFSAVLTPSADLLSMMLMLVPMVVLFEIAILIVGMFERQRKEQIQT